MQHKRPSEVPGVFRWVLGPVLALGVGALLFVCSRDGPVSSWNVPKVIVVACLLVELLLGIVAIYWRGRGERVMRVMAGVGVAAGAAWMIEVVRGFAADPHWSRSQVSRLASLPVVAWMAWRCGVFMVRGMSEATPEEIAEYEEQDGT